MHASTSPSKNASPSRSHRQFAETSGIVSRAAVVAGSRPRSCNSISVGSVEVQGWPSEKSSSMPPASRRRCAAGSTRRRPTGRLGLARRVGGLPPLGLDAGALDVHLVGRRLREVAQHLPPDRRVTVTQPVNDLHGRDARSGADTATTLQQPRSWRSPGRTIAPRNTEASEPCVVRPTLSDTRLTASATFGLASTVTG